MDLLDFYRGTLSARRIQVLLKDLRRRHDSAFVRALNDDKPGWAPTDHLLADLWILTVHAHSHNSPVDDHPVRAAMHARAEQLAKMAGLTDLKSMFLRRKRFYNTGSGGDD